MPFSAVDEAKLQFQKARTKSPWQVLQEKFSQSYPQLPIQGQYSIKQNAQDFFTKYPSPASFVSSKINPAPNQTAVKQAVPRIQNQGNQFAANLNTTLQSGINTLYREPPKAVQPFVPLTELGRGLAKTQLSDMSTRLTVGTPEQQQVRQITQKPYTQWNPQELKTFTDYQTQEGINLASGMMAPVPKPQANAAVQLLRKRIMKSDVDLIGKFAEKVETAGTYANKTNLGDIGKDIASLAENVFGPDARTWSNTKIKNAFDLVLGEIGEGSNRAGLGLNAREIGGSIMAAEKAVKEGVQTRVNPLRNTRPGSFTNIPEIDNPLLQGEEGVKALKQMQQKRIAELREFYSPQVHTRVEKVINDDFKPQTPIGKKINILDYYRTPDRVLEKIGLKEEGKYLRKQYESYLDELPVQLGKIEQWAKQVPKESNERIFRFLDGEKIALNPNEGKVAEEIKTYLHLWASKLKLPKEKRVSDYITHLFEKGAVEQDFPEELAKLIQGQLPSGVYNPFLQKRVGSRIDYLRDTWLALEAYTKRATRQFHMEPALKAIKEKSPDLEQSQISYLTNYAERINMRPTDVDTLIDNAVKASPIGYKLGQRPVTSVSRTMRQAVYRGTLGLNVGTAVRNLTQAANTYAKVGEKNLIKGYVTLAKNWRSGELEKSGVLRDALLQDRRMPAVKKAIDVLDKGLFALFETAEKINRGAAFYAGKAQAIDKGMNEAQAIEYAKKLVRDTQFQFGSIDTPLALQSDIAKTLTQFMSYPIKQTEFLGEMVKNKEFVGILRYIGATLVMGKVLKETLGLSIDVIPFQSMLSGETRFGDTPIIKAGRLSAQAIFGDEEGKAEAGRELGKTARTIFPGGVQIGKTFDAVKAMSEGGTFTKAGNLKFEVPPSARTAIFGLSSSPQAQEYYDRVFNRNASPEEKAAQDINREMSKSNAAQQLNAEKTYLEFKKLKGEERKTYFKKLYSEKKLTPELLEDMERLAKRDFVKKQSPFVQAVHKINTNKGKAKYIKKSLMALPVDERKAKYKELMMSGILTDGVNEELASP